MSCSGKTPLDWVKNLYSEPYRPYRRERWYLFYRGDPKCDPKSDPKVVEKILIDAGGFQKYSWASMKDRVKSAKDRVKSAFGRKPRQSI